MCSSSARPRFRRVAYGVYEYRSWASGPPLGGAARSAAGRVAAAEAGSVGEAAGAGAEAQASPRAGDGCALA